MAFLVKEISAQRMSELARGAAVVFLADAGQDREGGGVGVPGGRNARHMVVIKTGG